MILARLVEYEHRHDPTPPYFTLRTLRYLVELDDAGQPLEGSPRDLSDPKEPTLRRGLERLLPTVQRSSGIKPILFADKGDYTFGPGGGEKKPDRARQAHDAYLELVRQAARQTGLPEVEAVLRFLESRPRELLGLPDGFDEGATISFAVEGRLVVDLPQVREFWARAASDPDAPVMQCLVCGAWRPAARRLPLKVKRVPGGQSSGTSIISANENAFESYGLEASLTSPVCNQCAQAFTKGVNRLLADETTRVRFGSCAYVFWTRSEQPFNVVALLERPEPKDVEALFASPWKAREAAEVPSNRFYAVGLSGSGGRTVIRDWIDAPIADIQRHLSGWFSRQRLVGRAGKTQVHGLWALAGATVRDLRDVAPGVLTGLMRSALLGVPLPESLLAQAVRRCSAEASGDSGPVTAPRAALIKAVLATRHQWKEEEMVELDRTRPEPAYQCGRLLAVLERAQEQALGVRAVTERYYGAASSTPASVFGALMRGVVHHLAKLERDKPGAYRGIQQDLEEIASAIESFPPTLTLREQGLFALGYYHQRHARWVRRDDKDEREE